MHRKMHGHAARQSPDRQTPDGREFFFIRFNILIATAAVVGFQERITRSRFLFSTGVRWNIILKLYFLCMHVFIYMRTYIIEIQ